MKTQMLSILIITILIFTFLVGCKKDQTSVFTGDENTTSIKETKSVISDEGPTILGSKMNNPFTLTNMKEAYRQLCGGVPATQLQTNQLYVKFLISNAEEAKKLEACNLILSTLPLDHEISQFGVYYNDPSLTDQIWMYTTVDTSFDFTGYSYEIIDELFLPNLLIGKPQYNDVFTTFDHEDLIDKALLLQGYSIDATDRATYRPKGYIKFQQKISNDTCSQPVKNLKIRSRWWFDYGTGYTNDNGYFECDETYRKDRKVKIICIFENDFVNIRGIKGLQFWDIFFTERKNVGEYQNSALENIDCHFNNSTDLYSNKKRFWMACHAINSIREYNASCLTNSIPLPPSNLNLWLTCANANGNSLSTWAAAPMLKQMGNSSLLIDAIQLFLIASGQPWYAVVIQVLIQFAPDITYNYSQNSVYYSNTDYISKIFLHELAHGTHYGKVGNNYWTPYITYIVTNGGYGTSSTSGSGRIAISEAWAEFCAARFTHAKYGTNISIGGSYNSWLDYIEKFVPNAGTYGWIPDGVMHDLTDSGEPYSITGVIDNVSGYSISQCFGSMDSDVTSVSGYKSRFISEYGSSQSSAIQTLFNSYGY